MPIFFDTVCIFNGNLLPSAKVLTMVKKVYININFLTHSQRLIINDRKRTNKTNGKVAKVH